MEDGISGGLQHHHETCCKKGGCCERQACMVWKWFHCGDVVSGQVDLHMTQIIHRLQDKINQCQYGLSVIYINRVAIQQRLFVEFSYNPHINNLLKALLICVIIGLDVQWLPQQQKHLNLRTIYYYQSYYIALSYFKAIYI